MPNTQIERLGFNAYFGLEEIAVTRVEFEEALQKRVDKCINADFKFLLPDRETEKFYRHILIADTFFSDSFPNPNLKALFNKASQLEQSIPSNLKPFEFKFLLLNPFSELAKIRASALENESMGNVYWRLNAGLREILKAQDIETDENEFENEKQTIEYLCKQLEQIIEQQTKNPSFAVKFTSEYTDLPCYIIGPYAIKGVIFPETTAKVNPWWVYVDDPIETNDSYSKYNHALDGLWNSAADAILMLQEVQKIKEKKRKVFVSWGGQSETVKRIVFEEIEKKQFDSSNKFKAIDFQETLYGDISNLIPNIYKRGISETSAAIVLLLGEDKVTINSDGQNKEELRPRQNVVHELGFVQAGFPEANVLIVMQEGIKTPSNLDGEMVFKDSRNSLDEGSPELKLKINTFLDSIK